MDLSAEKQKGNYGVARKVADAPSTAINAERTPKTRM